MFRDNEELDEIIENDLVVHNHFRVCMKFDKVNLHIFKIRSTNKCSQIRVTSVLATSNAPRFSLWAVELPRQSTWSESRALVITGCLFLVKFRKEIDNAIQLKSVG